MDSFVFHEITMASVLPMVMPARAAVPEPARTKTPRAWGGGGCSPGLLMGPECMDEWTR
jgi:hypothetical protein